MVDSSILKTNSFFCVLLTMIYLTLLVEISALSTFEMGQNILLVGCDLVKPQYENENNFLSILQAFSNSVVN